MDLSNLLVIEPNNVYVKNSGKRSIYYITSLEGSIIYLKKDPTNVYKLRQCSETFYIMKRYEDSLVDLSRLLEIQPDNVWELRL
ncbi:hypothetical protein C2G38_2174777 [Gigaspora rosea]|uniref:Uncharacterized protein n=1 Tax=Gigaspora rosea TaxID=44941 RepID=A0A397VJS1_9GLOM|nr:hypothetical protein C2G38_2174777 [Gigaspora rosea]